MKLLPSKRKIFGWNKANYAYYWTVMFSEKCYCVCVYKKKDFFYPVYRRFNKNDWTSFRWKITQYLSLKEVNSWFSDLLFFLFDTELVKISIVDHWMPIAVKNMLTYLVKPNDNMPYLSYVRREWKSLFLYENIMHIFGHTDFLNST